jgi:hypothetical protein
VECLVPYVKFGMPKSRLLISSVNSRKKPRGRNLFAFNDVDATRSQCRNNKNAVRIIKKRKANVEGIDEEDPLEIAGSNVSSIGRHL